MLPLLSKQTVDEICALAMASRIASYRWKDRGKAPIGYTQGMAMSYATIYRKWLIKDPTAIECAKANTKAPSTDALAWYADQYEALGMSNSIGGEDTLRHLWMLILGLGMRESSGRHCEGRDRSASNVTAETAEAGVLQQSWNSRSASPLIPALLEEYSTVQLQQCALEQFQKGVTCTPREWASYGSGKGKQFQDQCKKCPQFAVEACAVGLRKMRKHWGPIRRHEAELRKDADTMFKDVQTLIDNLQPTVNIAASGK